MTQTPSRSTRPKLHYWLADNDLTRTAFAVALDVTTAEVSTFCLPWDNPNRRKPTDAKLARIVELTRGAVGAADFYPPHLRGDDNGAAEMATELAAVQP